MNKCLNENCKKPQLNKLIEVIQYVKMEFNKKKIESLKKSQNETLLDMKNSGNQTKELR